MKGFFITGTDTGVGKTLITTLLAIGLSEMGYSVTLRKPIETGCKSDGGILIPEDGSFYLTNIPSMKNENVDDITPIRFKDPLCPLAASRIENKNILWDEFITSLKNVDNSKILLIEGVGGVMVPITTDKFVYDLITELQLPVIVVCENRLGAINHTLLTLDFLKARKISVIGIIINHTSTADSLALKTNPVIIAEFSLGVPIIGTVPFISDVSSESLKKISKKYINYDIICGYLQSDNNDKIKEG
ncbi:MAG: dethiobiotin synthase [Nitrospirae bacterium]|nr:dethiobiotin synthase [Nitrospirota bacterium]MBF0534847.1 dethiobiotin synthase [Nitrospirota bacterium]MBF0616762.1 dethiobiotin synthase [Nitrospirota bacterium]